MRRGEDDELRERERWHMAFYTSKILALFNNVEKDKNGI